MREGTEIAVVDMGEFEDMNDAKFVGDALESTYPGYMWQVHSSRGVISVKCGQLAQFGNYGMVLEKSYSATNLRDLAIRAGGELLERCGLPRGKWTGEIPEWMEGAQVRQLRWHTPYTRRLMAIKLKADMARAVEKYKRSLN